MYKEYKEKAGKLFYAFLLLLFLLF